MIPLALTVFPQNEWTAYGALIGLLLGIPLGILLWRFLSRPERKCKK